MLRFLLISSFIFVVIFGGVTTVFAANATPEFEFQPIVSIPLPTGSGGAVDASTSLTDYLNAVFTLSIGISAILGVVMITFEGFKYMTSDVIGKKQSAVEGIQGAALGLLLLLTSYVILHVINPDILNLKALTDDLTALNSSAAEKNSVTGLLENLKGASANALPDGVTMTPFSGKLKAGCVVKCKAPDGNLQNPLTRSTSCATKTTSYQVCSQ